jgi:hypothetical protein
MNVETIARAALADLLDGRADEAAFGANRTMLTFLVFVDAVHYAPHALVDMAALGADFLAFELC